MNFPLHFPLSFVFIYLILRNQTIDHISHDHFKILNEFLSISLSCHPKKKQSFKINNNTEDNRNVNKKTVEHVFCFHLNRKRKLYGEKKKKRIT